MGRQGRWSWLLCASSPEVLRVPTKTANEADKNFAYFFRESISVLTNATLLTSADQNRQILTYEPPVKLQRKKGETLYLSITQTYLIIHTADGYKAQTTDYIYAVQGKHNDEFIPIFEFHWHPESTPKLKWPHMHINANTYDGDTSRVHFPTARICIEDFIKFLIRDFGIKPRLPYAVWREILIRNKAAFMAHASWKYWEPLIS
jgi:hypothetical protein